MSSVRVEINPDFLLQAKLGKVVEETGVTIDFAVCEAIANFLSSEGSNNPIDKGSALA